MAKLKFNQTDQVLKTDEQGYVVPVESLDYLPLSGGTLTGNVMMSNTVTFNQGIVFPSYDPNVDNIYSHMITWYGQNDSVLMRIYPNQSNRTLVFLGDNGGTLLSLNPETYEVNTHHILSGSSALSPSRSNSTDLGASTNKWKDIWASNTVIQTSDRNEKTEIDILDPLLSKNLILGLNPTSFKFINGTSDRTHYGFIAQEFEELLSELNIDTKNCAALVKDEDKEGNIFYGLRYDEFIAPLIKVVQEQQKEIDSLKEQLTILSTQIS